MKQNNSVFYGWWIVGGAVVYLYMSISLIQSSVSVFMTPLTEELGWQVWQYTLGPSLSLTVGAFSGIVVGPILDRRGPRPLILVGVVATALIFWAQSLQSSLWLYWSLWAVAGIIGWNLFSPLVINATVSKWFIQQRGWALSLGSIGVSLASLVTPLALTAVVDTWGWRSGYVTAGLFTLLVGFPLAFLMLRRPEDIGELPDGRQAAEDALGDTSQPADDEPALTAKQGLRTTCFWLFVVGFGLINAVISTVLFHAIPFAAGAGFARTTAAFGLTLGGLGNLFSKAVWGYTLQCFAPQNLLIFGACVASCGVGSMLLGTTTQLVGLLFLGFFLFGFGFGGTIPVGEYLWADYFGREHIGAIRGAGYPVSTLVTTAIPVLIGAWFDATQSYQVPFLSLIAIYLLAVFLIWVAPRPLS